MSTKRASDPNKAHKKVIFSAGRSKQPKGDGIALDTKMKGSRGSRNVEIDKDVSVCYGDNKLYLKEKGGRGKVKSSTKYKSARGEDVESDRGSKQTDNDHKRKRVYADRDNSRDENAERPKRRVLRGRNELRDDVGKERQSMRGEDNTGKERRSMRGEDNMGKERRSMRGEDNVGKERRPMRGEDDVGKERRSMRGKSYDSERYEQNKESKRERRSQEAVSFTNNDGRKLKPKGNADNKFDSRKQPGQIRDQRIPDSLGGKYAKKKMQDKKSGTSLAENDERPKRGKRVIRIDPRDITNKRLDDGISTSGHSKKKKEEKEDTEENRSDELSMNAQFRAIEPSPSILSFVEDNLLGRRRMIELRRAGYNIELSAPLDNIPLSTSLERERIEEPIFRNKLTFFAAAKVSSSFPPPELPEIAFAGRSNVGKSSLLNALTRQWGVVRTSDKPGLTQTINFFKLEPKLSLVDLPGYGFAYAKDEVKEAWEELVKEYVSTRVGLKRVCLLIDTKWGMKPRDYELIDLMERAQTKYQVVLTKTDLVFPIDVARRAMQIEESFKANKSAVQPVMMVSSKSGAGVRTLRTVLAKIGRFAKI